MWADRPWCAIAIAFVYTKLSCYAFLLYQLDPVMGRRSRIIPIRCRQTRMSPFLYWGILEGVEYWL